MKQENKDKNFTAYKREKARYLIMIHVNKRAEAKQKLKVEKLKDKLK